MTKSTSMTEKPKGPYDFPIMYDTCTSGDSNTPKSLMELWLVTTVFSMS